MKSWRRILRGAALLAAALALPCCTGDIGHGDRVNLVTVRVSVGSQGEQANGDSFGPSFSHDGRYVAFGSSSFNLSPNDGNGSIDVLVKDRVSGLVENITNLPPNSSGLVSGDSGQPSISADGRYVAFLSSGNFQDIGLSFTLSPSIWRPYLYDRVTGLYTCVHPPGAYLNAGCFGISLSADGRYLAFSTTSSNTGFTTSGTNQIYLCDFGPDRDQTLLTLVSHTGSTTTACNGGCNVWSCGISADGEIVAFESVATNLAAADNDAKPDVYFWRRSTGAVTLASVPSSLTRQSFMPGISSDGSTIGYVVINLLLNPAPGRYNCELYSIATGQWRTITDLGMKVDYGSAVRLSADGTRVLFGVATTAPILPYLYIEGAGVQLLTQSTAGQVPVINILGYAISGNGRWAGWVTPASNLVPDDTNGFSDVFLRGPY